MRRFAAVLASLTLLAILGDSAVSRAGVVSLIPKGADWRYLDIGRDLRTVWKEESYNDSAWREGSAPLGYGDDQTTVVSYGSDDRNKYVTTYFRHEFEVLEADLASFTTLNLSLLRDDGAAVYINGTEVFRTNLAPGALYDKHAAGGANEDTYYPAPPINPSLLNVGRNVVAVEVHQVNLTSSDISMDMFLEAISFAPTAPDYGDIMPDIMTGFEGAPIGATSFVRTDGSSELGWTMSGSGGVASVAGIYTDPNDPSNSRQFEVNDADNPVVITTERIDLRNSSDVQVSLDLRSYLDGGDFEADDRIGVDLFTSTDGVSFRQVPWISLAGVGVRALAPLGDPGPQNGPFTNFATEPGMIADDVTSLWVELTMRADSGREHILFDNLWVTAAAIGPVVVAWDELDDGNWGDPHWLNTFGEPRDPPMNNSYVVVGTNSVTVAENRDASTVTVNNGGTLVVADGMILTVDGATFEPETTLILGEDSALDVGGDPASLSSVVFGNNALIQAETTVTGTLSFGEGITEAEIHGKLILADDSVFSPLITGKDQSDMITVRGDIIIESGAQIEFRVSAADPFKMGDFLVMQSEDGIEELVGEFEIAGLGNYIMEDDGMWYTGNSLYVLIDYDLHPGDATLDTITDVRDFNVWNTNKFTSGTDWITGDFDGNGVTDVRDFNIWNTNKFTSVNSPAPPAGGQVPEPSTLILLAAGLVGLLAIRRRRES